MPGKVISQNEEVAFSSKADRMNRTNKVSIDKLIRVFCLFLSFTIIDLCDFYSLTTIADDLIRLVYKVDIEALKVWPECLEVEVS